MALKYQLVLCDFLLKPDSFLSPGFKLIKCVFKRLSALNHYVHFYEYFNVNPQHRVNDAKSVEIYGTKYCVNMIVVLDAQDIFPKFGQIVNIIVPDDGKVYFVLVVQKTLYYVSNLCSYVIENSNEYIVLAQSGLQYHTALWPRLSAYDGSKIVCVRHGL